MSQEFEDLRADVDKLHATVKQLKKLVKNLIRNSTHIHDWETTGEHSDYNVQRKCHICGTHEEYVYPMIPYESRWKNVGKM